jgi:cytidylate kinase
MTTNAFIFAWDEFGIESIVPISQYEHWDKQQLMEMLRDKPRQRNPLDSIVRNLILRAQVNPQRHYEIYAIDCNEDMNENFWLKQWEENPQFTADLIRERGHKLFSARRTKQETIIN